MDDFIVGSPARDDDFCFREEFLDDLWDSLKKHNILLLAPRRTGKTSVMYRMLDRPKDTWATMGTGHNGDSHDFMTFSSSER